MIYIVSFFISTFWVYLGVTWNKRNRGLSRFCFALGVLIVAVLAGVRDLTIGTDIQTYGEWLFKGAVSSNGFMSYVNHNSEIEKLFLVLVYGVSRLFTDSHWLYFSIALLQYGFTLAGILNFKDKISVPFSWLCFLLIFYGDTLNAMRQFIALAIAFWAFNFYLKKEYKKYIGWTVIAILFHNTAIISFLFAGIYFILIKKNTIYTRVGIVVGTLAATGLYSYIVQMFINIGILNGRFEKYLTTSSGFEMNPIIIRIPFIFLIFLIYHSFAYYNNRKYAELGKRNTDFLILILIIEILTAEMRAILPVLYRISFYFGYGKLIAYSRIAKVHPKNQRIFYSFFIIAFLIVLWVYQNVYQGNNNIYPYTSIILGIGG